MRKKEERKKKKANGRRYIETRHSWQGK